MLGLWERGCWRGGRGCGCEGGVEESERAASGVIAGGPCATTCRHAEHRRRASLESSDRKAGSVVGVRIGVPALASRSWPPEQRVWPRERDEIPSALGQTLWHFGDLDATRAGQGRDIDPRLVRRGGGSMTDEHAGTATCGRQTSWEGIDLWNRCSGERFTFRPSARPPRESPIRVANVRPSTPQRPSRRACEASRPQ
jgi:hypothetical protein